METNDRYTELLTEVRQLRREVQSVGQRVAAVRDLTAAHASLIASLFETTPVPPVMGWSIDARVLVEILRMGAALAPGSQIVELGSGVSTYWLAKLLGERGIQITSYEHDRKYLSQTQGLLERTGLGDSVSVRFAPLTDVERPWYSNVADHERIDLLVIDGPPGQPGYPSRLPALAAFADRIAAGGHVVLDDAVRDNDREALDAWLAWRGQGRKFKQIWFVGGAAILQSVETES